MSKTIHTIRIYDRQADRCHVVFGENQADVIARAKSSTNSADYYDIETWSIYGNDPTSEHGSLITARRTATLD